MFLLKQIQGDLVASCVHLLLSLVGNFPSNKASTTCQANIFFQDFWVQAVFFFDNNPL
jgi:hypothetical protein